LSETSSEVISELRRVAMLEPSSGRAALAKTSALRALLRLERSGDLTDAEKRLWAADRDEGEYVKDDDRYPGPYFADLDLFQTVAQRRRWWLNLRRGR
jgi:hypothetical protein